MRLSYAASEVAGQLVFCAISFYLLKFYTDVFGISAATAGTVLLLARLVDGLDAPLWGLLFERTRSRWGKSRPWFLWLCVPFATFGVLTFTTPHLSSQAKAIYATITYIVTSVLYTGINTPVTSILAALTTDTRERVVLTTFRMVGSKFGVLIVNLTLLRAVSWLGAGDDRLGFMRAVPIYAVGSVLLYLIAFRNLHEVVPQPQQEHAARHSFRALRGNMPWLIIFLSSLLFWTAFIARISTAPYYFEYVLHRPKLVSLANGLDFVSLGSVLFLPQLCAQYSKHRVWLWGLIGCVVAQVALGAATTNGGEFAVMAAWAGGFFCSGAAMAIPFSVLSDSVDYGEWKTGVRAAGLLTAIGAAFCLKAGSGFGGALPAWILAHTGYVPHVQQTARALHGVLLSVVWLPCLCYALAALPVYFYGHYERMEPAIQAELAARRAQKELGPA